MGLLRLGVVTFDPLGLRPHIWFSGRHHADLSKNLQLCEAKGPTFGMKYTDRGYRSTVEKDPYTPEFSNVGKNVNLWEDIRLIEGNGHQKGVKWPRRRGHFRHLDVISPTNLHLQARIGNRWVALG